MFVFKLLGLSRMLKETKGQNFKRSCGFYKDSLEEKTENVSHTEYCLCEKRWKNDVTLPLIQYVGYSPANVLSLRKIPYVCLPIIFQETFTVSGM